MKTWTVEYMVRERKGDYLAAVEELEASHKALVEALGRIATFRSAYGPSDEAQIAQAALKQEEAPHAQYHH